MKTDPCKACANEAERKLWAWVHDAIAHPLMALTNWSQLSLQFHDWTSYHAWPRYNVPEEVEVASRVWGNVLVTCSTVSGLFQVHHPRMAHKFGCKAIDPIEAVEIADEWFNSLKSEGY